MMYIRPSGIYLVHLLEHWRQVHGRQLAANGSPILDFDPSSTYEPIDLGLANLNDASVPAVKNIDNSPNFVANASHFLGSNMPLRSSMSSSWKHVKARGGSIKLDPFVDPSSVPPYTLLTGPPGIGKSALLQYAVAYARANGWIALAIPDAWQVMRRGLVLVKSKRRPGFVDQHDLALKLLREIRSGSQGELLARIPQRGKYASFRYLPRALDVTVSASREALRRAEEEEKSKLRAQAEAGGTAWDPNTFVSKYEDESDTSIDRTKFTLADMADWGLAHPSSATDALLDLISELRSVTEFPVLIAIDGHNLMYEETPYPMDGKNILPENLSIPSTFQVIGKNGFKEESKMARGLVLATVTQRHGRPMRMFSVANVFRDYRLPIPEATREEIHSQLLHYHTSQRFLMVQAPGSVDAFAVEYYRTLCSGRPREIFSAAMYQA
jgi:Mitochondrial ribosomal death-associated protein 3